MVSADYIEKKCMGISWGGGGARGRASDPRIYIYLLCQLNQKYLVYFLFLKTNLIEDFYIVRMFCVLSPVQLPNNSGAVPGTSMGKAREIFRD